MSEDRREPAIFDSEISSLLSEYGFAAIVGLLLLLNLTGAFKTVLGLDTAIFITLLAGYKTFYNSISALLAKTISADLALCVAVVAALAVGEYLAAAQGIGWIISQAQGNFDSAGVYAGMLILCIVVVLVEFCVTWIERRLIRWKDTDETLFA